MKRIAALLLSVVLLLPGCAQTQTQPEQSEPAVFLDPITTYEPEYLMIRGEEPTDPEEILAWRRNVVEQQMRHISSVRWTLEEDVSYSVGGDGKNRIHLVAGRTYQGIPYTHGSGSSFSWLSFATGRAENGAYILSGITPKMLTGSTMSRLGNDCADAVFWAWAQISSTISFIQTNHMTELFGCIKVGDYECDQPIYSNNTIEDCEENGEQRMFAAYSQLQKGDALVNIIGPEGGHAIMVVDVHVEYDGDEIDGSKSYVTILEQTASAEMHGQTAFDVNNGEVVYLCEVLDKRFSFNTLYREGYLPITCKELIDPSPLAKVEVKDSLQEPTVENMFSNKITATYRISSVTVNITDSRGELVQTATCYGEKENMYNLNLMRFKSKQEQEVMQGKIDVSALPKGEYNCKFICRVATGDAVTFRDFNFTVS